MHTFTIYRKTGAECDIVVPLQEYDNAFDAAVACIRMEQQSGGALKYEVVVTEAAGASKERT